MTKNETVGPTIKMTQAEFDAIEQVSLDGVGNAAIGDNINIEITDEKKAIVRTLLEAAAQLAVTLVTKTLFKKRG